MSGARPVVIAHRGASAYRPENTLPAYELAVAQGADMLEIDLHRTRDGEIVISHDASLAHFGRVGDIADLTLAEVRELDAGGGERVPTLFEVLDGFGHRLPINLEIKRGTGGRYEGIEAMALAAVEARGLLGRMLFSSFDDGVLEEVRRCSPEARLAALAHPLSRGDPVERARRVGAEAVNPDRRIATPELVAAAARAGLAVYSYTVDLEGEMERLLDLGVSGLFTNRPDVMRALVDPRAR